MRYPDLSTENEYLQQGECDPKKKRNFKNNLRVQFRGWSATVVYPFVSLGLSIRCIPCLFHLIPYI